MQEPIIHAEIQNFFSGLIQRKRLGHGYCFVGPKYVGKKRIALQIAGQILAIPAQQLETHPDFLSVQQEMNEKTGKTKKNIDIEQIKNIREFCSTLPLKSEKKVVMVSEAEKLNDHSSNALLKTLEEPKGNTVFFLLTEDEKALLPTIRSRVQTIYFYPQSEERIALFLQEQAIDTEKARALVHESRGLVEFALELNNKSEYYQEEKKRFLSLFGEPLYKKIQAVEPLFGEKKDSVFTREELEKVLSFWQIFNREKFMFSQDSERFESVYFSIHTRIEEAKKFLDKNVHPRLLIEQILVMIP